MSDNGHAQRQVAMYWESLPAQAQAPVSAPAQAQAPDPAPAPAPDPDSESVVVPAPDSESAVSVGAAARCVLCPRRCLLRPDGAAGVCGARANSGGTVYSLNYGRLTSIALDPIEKKPLRMFRPGARILSAGSFGCNLLCPFCQNHSLLRAPEGLGGMAGAEAEAEAPYMSPESLVRLALEARAGGNIGIAYTYNEPLMSYEYVLDAARIASAAGLDNVLVTNGCAEPAPLAELLPYVSALNVDVKGSESFYRELCGVERGHALRAVRMAREAGCHVEATCLLVTGRNDNEAAVAEVTGAIAAISDDIPLHLTRFFPAYRMSASAPTDAAFVLKAVKTARETLKHVFAGNVQISFINR